MSKSERGQLSGPMDSMLLAIREKGNDPYLGCSHVRYYYTLNMSTQPAICEQ